MFTTLLQHCPALSRHLRDDVRPMFKPNSHQPRYGSEMLTRQGFAHIHNYCLCRQTRSAQKESLCYFIQVFMYVTTAV